MCNSMSAREVLELLIEDLNDYIDDYRDSQLTCTTRLERQEYEIRKDELIRWKRSLKEQLGELED